MGNVSIGPGVSVIGPGVSVIGPGVSVIGPGVYGNVSIGSGIGCSPVTSIVKGMI